jgi:hypothetical protein
MTRGLGGPRVKARLAREGSRRGVLRAGRKKNVPGRGRFRPDPEKIWGADLPTALTLRRSGRHNRDNQSTLNLRAKPRLGHHPPPRTSRRTPRRTPGASPAPRGTSALALHQRRGMLEDRARRGPRGPRPPHGLASLLAASQSSAGPARQPTAPAPTGPPRQEPALILDLERFPRGPASRQEGRGAATLGSTLGAPWDRARPGTSLDEPFAMRANALHTSADQSLSIGSPRLGSDAAATDEVM